MASSARLDGGELISFMPIVNVTMPRTSPDAWRFRINGIALPGRVDVTPPARAKKWDIKEQPSAGRTARLTFKGESPARFKVKCTVADQDDADALAEILGYLQTQGKVLENPVDRNSRYVPFYAKPQRVSHATLDAMHITRAVVDDIESLTPDSKGTVSVTISFIEWWPQSDEPALPPVTPTSLGGGAFEKNQARAAYAGAPAGDYPPGAAPNLGPVDVSKLWPAAPLPPSAKGPPKP